MKDEGFLTAAGWRFVLVGALVILVGVATYFLLAEDISIDLDDLTQSSTTETTTDFEDFTTPDVTVPDIGNDPYFRCIDNADTAQEIIDCSNRANR